MRKKKYLTIDEKREWLAEIFRDESGDYTQTDKFKAMVEDTRLAELQEAKAADRSDASSIINLLDQLPPPREPAMEE